MTIAIDARACVRSEIGGVERYAREISRRLVDRAPARYRMLAPPAEFAHKVGHLWEQLVLPSLAASSAAIYCPANLAPVLSRRVVAVIHDTAALAWPDAYSPTYVRYQRALLPLIARRARHLITVSEFSKGEVVERLGVDPEQVTVISPGVDERFHPTVSGTSSPAGPYALAIGTTSARKNHALLARVADSLRATGTELVLAGGTRDYLRSGTGSTDGIRRLGYVPDDQLPTLYAGARMLVMPSLYEGFGLPCIEAMAAGVPVLAMAAGALPETCGDAALLVDPAEPGAFAAAAVELAHNQRLCDELIAAGRDRAGRFSWNVAADRTDALLAALDR